MGKNCGNDKWPKSHQNDSLFVLKHSKSSFQASSTFFEAGALQLCSFTV